MANWKFTHPNEDSITQPPNDNSEWKLKIHSPKWKFNLWFFFMKNKLKIHSPKWKFDKISLHTRENRWSTTPLDHMKIRQSKSSCPPPNENSTRQIHTSFPLRGQTLHRKCCAENAKNCAENATKMTFFQRVSPPSSPKLRGLTTSRKVRNFFEVQTSEAKWGNVYSLATLPRRKRQPMPMIKLPFTLSKRRGKFLDNPRTYYPKSYNFGQPIELVVP